MSENFFRDLLRELWLDRLEHSYYPQGHGRLATDPGGIGGIADDGGFGDHGTPASVSFCVLGTACEVFVELGGRLDLGEIPGVRSYSGQTVVLPPEVIEAFGFRSSLQIELPVDGRPTSLPDANDLYLLTFPELAELIRANYDLVFLD